MKFKMLDDTAQNRGFLCGIAVATVHAYSSGVQPHICREMIGTFHIEDFEGIGLPDSDFSVLKEICK